MVPEVVAQDGGDVVGEADLQVAVGGEGAVLCCVAASGAGYGCGDAGRLGGVAEVGVGWGRGEDGAVCWGVVVVWAWVGVVRVVRRRRREEVRVVGCILVVGWLRVLGSGGCGKLSWTVLSCTLLRYGY